MKLSTRWLKDYLDFDLSNDQLSEILTLIGLEVEGVETVEQVPGGLAGIKIGQVLTCEKHPGADKLSLTKVDLGGEEPVQIVCGAPNVSAGQKVPVATVGTTLYDAEGKPFKIKKGKIRGEVSIGMICAEDELGLGSSHDGIMVLDDSATVGSDAADYFDISSDTVFDIGLTPNRSDATYHIGCAEDLAAYLRINHDLHKSVSKPSVSAFDSKHTSKPFEIEVLDTDRCPRYSALTITDVQIGPSPEWMQERLRAVGVRPISNVVDITNYILHEIGQPLHAFDYDKVAGGKVVVRTVTEGSSFTTLDDVERKLSDQDLMICDGDHAPMCIAGVFGGAHSGVTDETATILLESAHFDAGSVRKSSTRHGLRTDAAKVFEKGSDPNVTVYALKRAALLLQEYASGVIASDIIDIYPKDISPVEIVLRYDKVRRLMGADISSEEIQNILRALNMEIKPIDEHAIKVYVPTNKAEVLRDVDLIEEILRIYGFNKIEVGSKISSTITYRQHGKQTISNKIAHHLAGKGFHEMMGLSLVPSALYADADFVKTDDFVQINNTSNIHLDIMRPEMMVSGLQSVVHNHNRQQLTVRLFELGKSYLKAGDDFQETEYLTVFLSGQSAPESWRTDYKRKVDFYDIKQAAHSILDRLGVSGYQVRESDDSRLDYGLIYHRGKQVIATFGAASTTTCDAMGVKAEVFYAELPIEALVKAAATAKVSVQAISKYPSSRRDLALVVDETVAYQDIEAIAKKAGKKLLKEVTLFDIYKNEDQLGKGKKSYAVGYTFEDVEKTLKDKDIEKIMQKLITTYQQKLGAEVRS